MSLTICLLLSCLIVCGARADVSEILAKTNQYPAEEIQSCIVLNTNPHHHPEASTVLPEHGPVPSSSSVDINVKSAVEVASDGQQLDISHPDYQGPYHYEQPPVLLDYAAPPTTDVPQRVGTKTSK